MEKRAEELADLENANTESTPFHEILLKQEPLDKYWPETCPDVQDSLFNVVKQEVCGDRSETKHSRNNNVDVAAGGTHSSVKHVKSEPVQAEASLPTDTLNTDNQPTTDGDTVLTVNDEISTLKHLLTEYNIECHRCNICNYQCAYRSVLKRHMTIHTVEKPYCCKHCDFKCSRVSYLKQHMKIHTREKLYVASIVNKLYQVGRTMSHKTKQ